MARILLAALAALAVLAAPAWADNGGAALLPPAGAGGAAPGVSPRAKPKPKPKPAVKPKPKPKPKMTPAPTPAPSPTPSPTPTVAPGLARFPVLGAHGYGGPGARFGAPRSGHIHQGQDVVAAEGTPIVAPLAGLVIHRSYQAGGAGYYLVIQGDDGRDYVFMHLESGSIRVGEGRRVSTGQRIGAVGTTGDSAGPHLHFEIWIGGWQAPGGRPIDPLPTLRRWDAYS